MFSFFKKRIIRQDRLCRTANKWYLARYYATGEVELWRHDLHTKEEKYLGSIVNDKWEEPADFQSYYMTDFRATQRAVGLYFLKAKKVAVVPKKKIIYDTEYFRAMGKIGQEKVKRIHGIGSAAIRQNKRKLSTEKLG